MECGMNTDDQPQVQEEGREDTGKRSVCLQRHLADSIYLWACGEKAENEEHDPGFFDIFIGWLILLVQGLAYGMLIVLARSTDTDSSEDDDTGGRAKFLLASVTGAIYLLMVSTSHDLRAGFSLLVDGARAGHRAFGAALLVVYGIMISAALTVLASTSNDSASLLLNAVAVLFLADLDEKALKFFSTIPQNTRLFWAMEFIGISFSLALIAVFYIGEYFQLLVVFSIGESFELLKGIEVNPQGYPTWVIWVLNPTVVTICSYLISASLHTWFDSCSAALETVDPLTFFSGATRACSGSLKSLQHIKESFRREPVFYVVLGVWLVHGVLTELYRVLVSPNDTTTSIGFYLCLGSRNSVRNCINEIGSTFLYIINAMLVVGIVMKTSGRYLPRPARISALQEPCRFSGVIGDINKPDSYATVSRLPSLLVGLGVGYWVAALLVTLASSWPGGGWCEPPTALSVVAYVCLPSFALVSLFMVADTDVLGVKFGAFIKPAVDMLLDRRSIVYWVMMAVFRDAFLLWALETIFVGRYVG